MGETEFRDGLGGIGGRSEPFFLKRHSLLLEGVLMVGVLPLKRKKNDNQVHYHRGCGSCCRRVYVHHGEDGGRQGQGI